MVNDLDLRIFKIDSEMLRKIKVAPVIVTGLGTTLHTVRHSALAQSSCESCCSRRTLPAQLHFRAFEGEMFTELFVQLPNFTF